MTKKIDYLLYLVTDAKACKDIPLEAAIEQAIIGGCTVIQLREKNLNSLDFFNLAKRIKLITDKYDIPLIINDRVDIARSINASGVHLGQNDLPIKAAREILGDDKLIGVSTNNPIEAKKAEDDGADYIGVGAVFATNTKTNTRPLPFERLIDIRNSVSLPIVAIGGITKERLPYFNNSKINGVAVASAILSESNILEGAKAFKESLKAVLCR